MSLHLTHKLSSYLEDRKQILFCRVCSAEGDLLSEPCPGQFIKRPSVQMNGVDKSEEHN
jgi:hypothetical protein